MADFETTKEHKEGFFRSGYDLLTDPEAFQAQMITAQEEWRQKEVLSEQLVEGIILR